MPKVSVKDLECVYEDDYFGDPWIEHPPVVLLQHGFQDTTKMFRQWIPGLASKYRVIRRALVGHGGTTGGKRDRDLSLEALANDVVDFIDSLDIESVHFLGHHTGAMSGVVLGALHADRVRSLGLFDCPVRCGEDLQKVMARMLPEELRGKYTGWNDAIAGLGGFFAWRDQVGIGVFPEDPLRSRWQYEQLRSCDEDLMERYAEATKYFDIERYLSEVAVPALILAPSVSEVTTLGDQFKMRLSIPNAEIEVIEVGHPNPADRRAIEDRVAKQASARYGEFLFLHFPGG